MNASDLSLVVPSALGLAALGVPAAAPLRYARRAALVNAALSLAVVVGGHVDLVGAVMLLLVALLGAVIMRYSETYLEGEPGLERYARAMLWALAGVTALVLAWNLAVVGIAWLVTSLALHHLLTFYPDRPAAVLAAHKKFVQSRAADVLVLVAVGLVGVTIGGLELAQLDAFVRQAVALPPALSVAAVLLVLAVALRAAQLPFHGWLTQVMEAPTPVSALLHAGVVNLGAIVLLRVSGLIDRVPAARWLLVTIGLSTAIVAGLVMMTRVSVKLSLAWSTCAQLGFMLVQCGLGAWHLALLHVVAHSLYKSHAFLSAGSRVAAWRREAMAPTSASYGALLPLGVGLVATVAGLASGDSGWLALVAAAPLAPVLVYAVRAAPSWRARLRAVTGATLLGGVLAAWHDASAPLHGQAPGLALLAFAAAGFVGLLVLLVLLQRAPTGRLARVLQPRLFQGFSLDEHLTRLLVRAWPPPDPATATEPAARPLPSLETR